MDHYKGWEVAPGGISYSHTGYQSGSSKTAFASDLDAEEFLLIRLNDNAFPEIVLSKPVEQVATRLGEYQLMDFLEAQKPGRYIIRAGDRKTRTVEWSAEMLSSDAPWVAVVIQDGNVKNRLDITGSLKRFKLPDNWK